MRSILLLVAVVNLIGCAAEPIKESSIPEEKVYRTGSNLPQRDRASTVNKDAAQQEANRATIRTSPMPGQGN
jgi:hypothetical protein